MEWNWKKFGDLSGAEIYEMIRLRERVFVVEQKCFYLDCDGLDPVAWHLFGREAGVLVAYARAFAPGIKYAEASCGRVAIAPEIRGRGLGRELMKEVLARMSEEFGEVPVRISAQSHLREFYASLGFQAVGEDYLEDGIPHLEMRKI
jgi:ElaA protein